MAQRWVLLAWALLVGSTVAGAAPPPAKDWEQQAVVGFHGPVPDDAQEGKLFHGARVVRVDEPLRFAVVRAASAPAFLALAAGDERVRYVEPDPLRYLLDLTPNDARYASMYGPQQIGAPAAWDRTLGATSVVLCTGDTGVRRTHEDLGAARYGGGFDFINNDNDPADDHGHGTHVTGTATATTNNGQGIAGIGQATYKHAKVLNSGGSGSWSQVSSGIRWCADNGAHAISLSLGGSGGATELQDAVNYAWGRGVVVVAAAGNSGPCTNCVGYPGAYANAIAVACTTSTKARCSFSSQGPEVDLAAPGSSIDSTSFGCDSCYTSLSGTSMSTPHVAGTAVLVKALTPSLTAAQIRSALEGTAEDLGPAGDDNDFGLGLVRADRAVGANLPPVASFTLGCSDATLACSFDASASSDPDGAIASYAWTFGDGQGGSGRTTSHTYAAAGLYTVTLTVTDNQGAVGSTQRQADVGNLPPTARFTVSCNDDTRACTLDGTTSTDADGTIASYAWAFGDGATATGSVVTHTYPATGTYTATLTVTDDGGASDGKQKTFKVGWTRAWIEDFEDGAPDWVLAIIQGQMNARVGGGCLGTYGGTKALQFNKASDCTYNTGGRVAARAKGPSMNLAGSTEALLRYRHAFEVEQGRTGKDTMRIFVASSCANANFVEVDSWSSTNVNRLTYKQFEVDVSAHISSDFCVRLKFDSEDDRHNGFKGWHVDDIEVLVK